MFIIVDAGIKLAVENEKSFKTSLNEINQQFRVLGSELKLVSSEFDKNDKSLEAITARNDVLGKSIDTQKDKIATLEAALRNASESFGENDNLSKSQHGWGGRSLLDI